MIESKQFKNIGYSIYTLTDEQVAPIKAEIQKIQSNFENAIPANSDLAGQIKKEYYLTESKNHMSFLQPMVTEFERQFSHMKSFGMLTEAAPVVLDDVWVNFQQKGEYNPPHDHSGVYSFALWIQVPFDIKDEQALFPKENNASTNPSACFNFNYTNALGKTCGEILPVDRTWENKIVLFPASLVHYVNPFYTSDEFRISVSGNFKFYIA
jgi:hypothetical protein